MKIYIKILFLMLIVLFLSSAIIFATSETSNIAQNVINDEIESNNNATLNNEATNNSTASNSTNDTMYAYVVDSNDRIVCV